MPTYVRAALLATALLATAPADAVPICQYAGTTGTLLREQVLAHPCVGYGGTVRCLPFEPGTALVGLALVICVPEA